MAMTTNQRKIRDDRRFAWLILSMCLSASTAGNVVSSWDKGIKGWVIAGFAPLAAFGCFGIVERFSNIRNRWLVLLGMTSSGLVAASISFIHIHGLVYQVFGDNWLATLAPISVDIPMLISSYVLSAKRMPQATRTNTAKAKKVAKKTVPTQRAKAPKVSKTQQAVNEWVANNPLTMPAN